MRGILAVYDGQPSEPTRLGARLVAARRRRFVGRAEELELLRSAVLADEPEFALLYVHGPGGVGKTSLLETYRWQAADHGLRVVAVDARSVEPSPDGFLQALAVASGASAAVDIGDFLADGPRCLLTIDTYELLAPLDTWLRERLLPRLPSSALVVIAGRRPPAVGWQGDPGWADLMRVCSLRNLPPDDSRAYLRSRGIPEDRHAHLVALTHGHPLALSLVADLARQDRSSSAALTLDNPDIMRVLLDRFVESVPSEAHREALELCAHARSTSEELLGVLFEPPLAGELFEWLRSLSFVDAGPLGIYPHDVARDVLDADFRWRNPSEYRRIHGKVREFVLRRIDETQGTIKQQAFFDLQFLHRSSPALQGYYTWTQMGTAYAEPAKLADHPEILQMVERFEGMESATIARHWLARQPEGFTVFRDAGSDLIGFLGTIALRETDAEDLDIDPAVRAAWEFAQRHGPLRPGEQMLYHRFLMERDVYQAPSPAMEMAHMSSFFDWLATARLGWIFIQLADPDYWESLMSYYILLRVPEGDFEVGGRHYGVFAHDFRVQPILKWIDEVARRELADEATLAALKASMPAPIVVLSEQDFADAVRQALRDYTQPERLAANPLLRSRLVIEHADGMPDVPALQDLLQQAAESLHGRPRDEKLYRAVWRTYFAPAASQEVAAESLDLPFSTYRYQLTNGIERISAWLWEREVHGWSEQSA